jgi:plastocyanin
MSSIVRRAWRPLLAGLVLMPHHLPAAPAVPAVAVAIDNFSFKDPVITVGVGTRVTWTNRDDIPHTVTADGIPPGFRSHPLDTGEQFAMQFDKAGSFRYFCSLHPKMRGTVIVR